MKNAVYEFLKARYNKDKGVCLALSGGADSLVLLHLLLELKESLPLQLAVAHVDHNWRSASGKEAEELKKLAEKFGLVYHLKVLNPNELKGNLESTCRRLRLQFFKQVCSLHGYQAVLLAHHADDQAETVLKKILEGSSLPYLAGLREEAMLDGLQVWRPLLNVRKSEILEKAKAYNLTPFEDETNHDPRFLRGKFRTAIFPSLAKEFGKEIVPSLNRIASEAIELGSYLETQTSPVLKGIAVGPFGSMIDLSSCSSNIELNYVIHKFCEASNFYLSHALIKTIIDLLKTKAANKRIQSRSGFLIVDRQRLFIVKNLPSPYSEILPLAPKAMKFGPWAVVVKSIDEPKPQFSTSWRDAWKGRAEVVLPQGDYTLKAPNLKSFYPGTSSLSDHWTDAKVPAFLRFILPTVWEGNSLVHEFLTGSLKRGFKGSVPMLSVSLVWEKIKVQVAVEGE